MASVLNAFSATQAGGDQERGERVIRTIFDKATLSLGTIRVISKVALMAGSSQQGKALRASVAWSVGTAG